MTPLESTVKLRPEHETENIRGFIGRQGKSVPDRNAENLKIAERLRALLKKLGMTQAEFASALQVGQGNVSKWLTAHNRPSPDVMARIASLAPDVEKFFFLEKAGVPKEYFLGTIEAKLPSQVIAAVDAVVNDAFFGMVQGKTEAMMVPILSDAVAAGSPLAVNESDITEFIPLPTAWLPPKGHVFLLRVDGDSMAPIVRDGDLVMVDVTKRDPKDLVEAMVAARVGDGVTIKYLRREGKFWQLVPQNTSPRHAIRVLTENDDWAVVGEVVKCISNPPKPRRSKGAGPL